VAARLQAAQVAARLWIAVATAGRFVAARTVSENKKRAFF
jgi:hypothetical protein